MYSCYRCTSRWRWTHTNSTILYRTADLISRRCCLQSPVCLHFQKWVPHLFFFPLTQAHLPQHPMNGLNQRFRAWKWLVYPIAFLTQNMYRWSCDSELGDSCSYIDFTDYHMQEFWPANGVDFFSLALFDTHARSIQVFMHPIRSLPLQWCMEIGHAAHFPFFRKWYAPRLKR